MKNKKIGIGLLIVGVLAIFLSLNIGTSLFTTTSTEGLTCGQIVHEQYGSVVDKSTCLSNTTKYAYTGQCNFTEQAPTGQWSLWQQGCQGTQCFRLFRNTYEFHSWTTCSFGYCTNSGLTTQTCENPNALGITLKPNQLVVMETFSAGTILSVSSMRYPPVFFMGDLYPVMVLDGATNRAYTNSSIYNSLIKGNTLRIPDTQVWAVYYAINNSYNLPSICTIYDVDNAKCVGTSIGLVTLCSQGVFDASLGACVVQPESRYICPDGGRYDSTQAVCIINPPLNQVCTKGTLTNIGDGNYACIYQPETIELNGTVLCTQGNYDQNRNACVYEPNVQYLCLNGNYDALTNTCTIVPEEKIVCASGFTYNQTVDKCIKYPLNEESFIKSKLFFFIGLILLIAGLLVLFIV